MERKSATMTMEEAVGIIDNYNELLQRALLIVSKAPYYHGVEHEENAVLTIEEDEASISWIEAESDYYGGYSVNERMGSFPARLLLESDDTIKKLHRLVAAEEKEKSEKVAKAQAIILLERQVEAERALFAQLSAKYDKS